MREGNFPTEMYSPPNLTTASGTFQYTPDTDMGIVHRVWLVESGKRTPLEYLSVDVLDDDFRYDGSTQTNAKPTRWTFTGGKIELDPVPDKAYTIAYRGERKTSSVSNIPDQFRDVLVAGGLSFFIPAYIPVFERGKMSVKRYWRSAKPRKRGWAHSGIVKQHQDERYDRNVS